MRNISFSMTTEAYRRGEKTVTRRLGWGFLRPGDLLMGVEKCQGLKKGERVVKIHPLRVVSVGWEPLNKLISLPSALGRSEMCLEGFPGVDPREFVELFCKHNKCMPDTPVNRIEFVHLPAGASQ